MNIEDLKEKIQIVRNDTNAYGFDNDNINLADILEAIIGLYENGNFSTGSNENLMSEDIATGSNFE